MNRLVFSFVAILIGAMSMQARAVTLDDVGHLMTAAPPVEGTDKAVSNLRGRPVVVTFFASWCPPCTAEFRHLNNLRARLKGDEVAIVGINQFEAWGGKANPARMARFLGRTKPRFPLIQGSEALRVAFGNVERIPTVVVIGADGSEAWRFVHQRGATKTHATMKDLEAALTAAGLAMQ